MGNEKSKERSIFSVLAVYSRCQNFTKIRCNIVKALSQRIDSFSEDDVNTIMASMQGIIDEGSDHIKSLELKIKAQGTGKILLFLREILLSDYIDLPFER